jgi:hypothetical protein
MNPSDPAIEKAAKSLAMAVRDYLSSKPTGKGRRTTQSWTAIVAKSLGKQRVDRRTFALVVATALDQGWLIKRKSESGRETLHPGPQLLEKKNAARPASSVEREKAKAKSVPPVSPFPADNACPNCKWKATRCVHCNEPAFDDDIYVDSRGRWRCNSCNDLCFTESWGGVTRWKSETN